MSSTSVTPESIKYLSEAEFGSFEQTRYLYEGWRTSLISNAATCTLTAGALWPVMDKAMVLAWYCFALSIVAVRTIISKRFISVAPSAKDIMVWKNLMLMSAFLTALPWMFAAIAFVSPELPDYSLIVTSVFVGFLAACTLSWSSYQRCFMFFAIPSVAMFVVRYALIGSVFGYSVAVLLTGYLLIITSFTLNSEKAFLERARLLYENTKLAEEMTKQKEKAEKAFDVKTQFLAAASHDLRQPLQASAMFVEALQNTSLTDNAKHIVGKLQQSTESLNKLLHGLLDISRLDADVVEYNPEHFCINTLLERLVEDTKQTIDGSQVTISLNVEDGLFIYCDPILLERVLRNLIDNSAKYTEQGDIGLAARAMSNGLIEIEIKDSGLGIPSDKHAAVFGEFVQLQNPERDRRQGLGLGLAIVKRLCDLMQIPVQLDSEFGQGTTIKLQVNVGKGREKLPSKGGAIVDLVGQTVLVIDDEIDILEAANQTLIQVGATVVTAVDAVSAIRELVKLDIEPSVIVSDLRLRESKNGITCIRQIRDEFNRDIPAVLLTGDTSPERLSLAKSSGLEIMHKPITGVQLKAKISSLLKNSASQSAPS